MPEIDRVQSFDDNWMIISGSNSPAKIFNILYFSNAKVIQKILQVEGSYKSYLNERYLNGKFMEGTLFPLPLLIHMKWLKLLTKLTIEKVQKLSQHSFSRPSNNCSILWLSEPKCFKMSEFSDLLRVWKVIPRHKNGSIFSFSTISLLTCVQ